MEPSDEVRAEVASVHPTPGDLLILTMPEDTDPAAMQTAVNMVRATLEEMGVNRVGVLCLWKGMKITEASDGALAAYGLKRVSSVADIAVSPTAFDFAASGFAF